MKDFKRAYQKAHHEITPIKKRIISAVIALPIAFFVVRLYGLSLFAAIMVTIALAVLFTVSFILEQRSYQKDTKFKAEVESGQYYAQDVWRDKYLAYRDRHGFDKIKGSSMKADLAVRFRRPSAYIMIAVSLLLLCACLLPDLSEDALAGFIIGAVVFGIWGVYGLTSAPVREFMKQYADEIDEIAESYMNGRMLTFKHNWSSEHVCSGINIGRRYTVLYNKKKITAIKNADIQLVHRYIKRTKYYGNGIYTGDRNTFHLAVMLRTQPERLTIELNEFQAQMAIDEYRSYSIPVTSEENIVPDKNVSIVC